MKKLYILSILTLFTIFSCKAQSPIIDIEDYSYRNAQEGAYYKDINNYFNVFEGTWLYTEGTTSFKIVLEKKEMRPNDIVYYKDYVSGEYQYIENGVERINTLDNTDVGKVAIAGHSLLKSIHRPFCTDCPTDEKRLRVGLSDRIAGLTARLTIRAIEVGGQEALEINIWGNGVGAYDVDNPPEYMEMIIPTGTFVFLKQ